MSTGDWDLFLGPLERARAETGGDDQQLLKRREFPGVASVNSLSHILGIPTVSFQQRLYSESKKEMKERTKEEKASNENSLDVWSKGPHNTVESESSTINLTP